MSKAPPRDAQALRVYLAGPEVFLPDAAEIGRRKQEICARSGFEGVFPTPPPGLDNLSATEAGVAIFDRCIALMEEVHLVVANMTPFRGVSIDAGTAVEMGFMYGRGRPVFGYSNVTTDYSERVEDDGMAVERFAFADSLMCEGMIRQSGGTVVRMDTEPSDVIRSLAAFSLCVQQAATSLAVRRLR